MSTDRHEPSLRLVAKNVFGVVQAIPYTDTLKARSGFDEDWLNMPDAFRRAILGKSEAKQDNLRRDDSLCSFWDSQSGRLYSVFPVGLSVVQLFEKISAARKNGDEFVDLTDVSGLDVLMSRVAGANPPSRTP